MTLTSAQVERATKLVAQRTGPDVEWLEIRLQENTSADAFGDPDDLAAVARTIYDDAPEWIGLKLFGLDWQPE